MHHAPHGTRGAHVNAREAHISGRCKLNFLCPQHAQAVGLWRDGMTAPWAVSARPEQCHVELCVKCLSGRFAVQYVTLLFIGCISATSLRGFLKNTRKVSSSV